MNATLSLFAVLALAFAVLGAMALSESRSSWSIGVGLASLLSVLLGGPGTIFVLGVQAGEPMPQYGRSANVAQPADAAADSAPDAPPDGEIQLRQPIELHPQQESGGPNAQRPTSPAPAWISLAEQASGTVNRRVVSSEPRITRQESERSLDEELTKATQEYLDKWIMSQFGQPRASQFVGVDLDFIHARLRSPDHRYIEQLDLSVGPMFIAYGMLEFNEEFHKEVNRRWQESVARHRLLYTAVLGGSLLSLLAVVFSYFRLDTATHGYYTGRLQFLAVAAILTLIGAGVAAARWIP